ncbi:hypothetical protein GD1_39 [Paraglaciecola Antarctic GD virus 1]|nr:hypothetical protein GD1_39 [Paraglaciecola Antarctic GD virus 1]
MNVDSQKTPSDHIPLRSLLIKKLGEEWYFALATIIKISHATFNQRHR